MLPLSLDSQDRFVINGLEFELNLRSAMYGTSEFFMIHEGGKKERLCYLYPNRAGSYQGTLFVKGINFDFYLKLTSSGELDFDFDSFGQFWAAIARQLAYWNHEGKASKHMQEVMKYAYGDTWISRQELSWLLGIKPSKVAFLSDRGLFQFKQEGDAKHRFYNKSAALKRYKEIVEMQKKGKTLKYIKKYLNSFPQK